MVITSMEILVFGDVHSNIDALSDIIKKIKIAPDVVICPGDFTDMFNSIEGFSQIEVADMVLQKLLSFNCPVLCVPGNHDPYEIIKLFNKYSVNLHGKSRKIKDLFFIGWGGASTPFNTYFEPGREETITGLEKISRESPGEKTVLVVHEPPKNTKVDRISTGQHVGSMVIRKFIESKKPLLCLSAHIHESGGEDMIGRTKIFYPGPVYEGFYGKVFVEAGKVKCERKKI